MAKNKKSQISKIKISIESKWDPIFRVILVPRASKNRVDSDFEPKIKFNIFTDNMETKKDI